MLNKKMILMILDGWGIGDRSRADAVFEASTPNLDNLFLKFPNSTLSASGLSVGLPEGVMGNSEVGHLNLGAGRIIYQDLVKINLACENGDLAKNPVLLEAFNKARENGRLHFIGLLSDAGVHAMNSHLYKLCDLAKLSGVNNVFVHALGDGRDTDPHSGYEFIKEAEEKFKKNGSVLASLVGRYYTMDRDKRWERIKEGYDLMVKGKGLAVIDFLPAIKEFYEQGITDEFLSPMIKVGDDNKPLGLIEPDDVVICFNYRTERLREITIALTQENLPEFEMEKLPLSYYTLTKYDDKFKGVKAIFEKEKLKNTLGEVIALNDLKQLRIAETEKYAHVTFFFSGGQEEEFLNEERILIPSPKVATYDLTPEMSAFKIKDSLVKDIREKQPDFVCVNFANGDMVGHTGVYAATIKAIESVDICAGEVVAEARKFGYDILITADHGNAELALNIDGTPNTAHSLNPVPCLLISDEYKKIDSGSLADIAPTILKIMNLPIPPEMTGRSLV